MATKLEYPVSASGGEWTNQVEIVDMDENQKHIFLDITSGRGMSYFVTLNIHQGQILLSVPYHDIGIFIAPPNDPEYLFLKLREFDINPVDVNNIIWGLVRVWQELFNEPEQNQENQQNQ